MPDTFADSYERTVDGVRQTMIRVAPNQYVNLTSAAALRLIRTSGG